MISIISPSLFKQSQVQNLPTLDDDEDDLSVLADQIPKSEDSPDQDSVFLADDDLDVAPSSDAEQNPEFSFSPTQAPKEEPADPGIDYEEIPEPEEEQPPQTDIRGAIFSSMNSGAPLRIIYTSLAGHTSERTVLPDYIYWAGTRRHVMVAWCTMKNGWRAFIVDHIREAKVQKQEQQ